MRNKYVIYSNQIQDIVNRLVHSTYAEKYSRMEKRVATILDEEGNACAENKYFSLRNAFNLFGGPRDCSGFDEEYNELKELNIETMNYFDEILFEYIMKYHSLSITFVNMFIEKLDKHEDLKEEIINYILSMKALPDIQGWIEKYAPNHIYLKGEIHSIIDVFTLIMVVRKKPDVVFEKELNYAKEIKDKFCEIY